MGGFQTHTNNALVQVKDLQVKLDEAEQQAMKGGRKVGMGSTMWI